MKDRPPDSVLVAFVLFYSLCFFLYLCCQDPFFP